MPHGVPLGILQDRVPHGGQSPVSADSASPQAGSLIVLTVLEQDSVLASPPELMYSPKAQIPPASAPGTDPALLQVDLEQSPSNVINFIAVTNCRSTELGGLSSEPPGMGNEAPVRTVMLGRSGGSGTHGSWGAGRGKKVCTPLIVPWVPWPIATFGAQPLAG